ncbi:hypothetical protein VTO73DRAFT_7360 [Trametes versicolor]
MPQDQTRSYFLAQAIGLRTTRYGQYHRLYNYKGEYPKQLSPPALPRANNLDVHRYRVSCDPTTPRRSVTQESLSQYATSP